jgi:hypothetical protein
MMPTKVTRSAADVVEWIVRATARVELGLAYLKSWASTRRERSKRSGASERAETLRARPSAVMTPRICRAGDRQTTFWKRRKIFGS